MHCQCQGIEQVFNQESVARQLEHYRRKGAARTTRMLTEAIQAQGMPGQTLLDIGGGVGAVQHLLLEAGVQSVTGVDASPAYIHAARAEAERRGFASRVSYLTGNFVELAAQIEPADMVTLDRVICCYPDMEALVRLSAQRARCLVGLVYPRSTWWIRLGLAVGNLLLRLSRSNFRIFAHPTQAVEALLRQQGFEKRSYSQTMVWQVVVFSR